MEYNGYQYGKCKQKSGGQAGGKLVQQILLFIPVLLPEFQEKFFILIEHLANLLSKVCVENLLSQAAFAFFGIPLITCRFACIKTITVKIEQALVLYLLKNKQISLQGIGTFSLDIPLPEVTDNDKPVIIPANAVSFHYDPKVGEEETIVDFIVEHTKKIKPLASADLDSFLTLGRQFLNIGKPFTIQNLGTLDKLKSGELEFKPGQLILQKMEAPKDITENDIEENDAENLFNDYQNKTPRNSKGIWLTILILLVLGFGAWAAWNFIFKKDDKDDDKDITQSESIVPLPDTLSKNTDSLINSPLPTDSNSMVQKPISDSTSFYVVVADYTNKEEALARIAKLKTFGRNLIMYTDDSITYKIGHAFTLPLSDTTKILDSLNRYYYVGKAYIDLR